MFFFKYLIMYSEYGFIYNKKISKRRYLRICRLIQTLAKNNEYYLALKLDGLLEDLFSFPERLNQY